MIAMIICCLNDYNPSKWQVGIATNTFMRSPKGVFWSLPLLFGASPRFQYQLSALLDHVAIAAPPVRLDLSCCDVLGGLGFRV